MNDAEREFAERRLRRVLTWKLGVPPRRLREGATVAEMGLDPVDLADLALEASREFGIPVWELAGKLDGNSTVEGLAEAAFALKGPAA